MTDSIQMIEATKVLRFGFLFGALAQFVVMGSATIFAPHHVQLVIVGSGIVFLFLSAVVGWWHGR